MRLWSAALLLSLASGSTLASDWIQVSPQSEPVWLELPALVEAVNQSTISAQTSGRITELPYDVNDYVPQGAVVVRFTDTEQKARVEQANAALAEASTRFDEMSKELIRIKDIHSKGLVAKAALDMAQANFNAAKARYEQAQAAGKAAREQLEQTVVRAPYSGILQQRLVQLGELAVPGKPLLQGLSLEHLRVVTQLPQSQQQRVRQSEQAQLQLQDGAVLAVGKPELTIAPQANSQSHSFQLRVKLPQADYGAQNLFPGSWVRLRFQTGSEQQLQVPTSAVLWRGEVSMVWLKQQDNIALQPVRLMRIDDQRLMVLSGLKAGAVIAQDAKALLAQSVAQDHATTTAKQ